MLSQPSRQIAVTRCRWASVTSLPSRSEGGLRIVSRRLWGTARAQASGARWSGKEVHVTSERKERRGFASMSPERQREIASKGGRAAHEKGTAHEWTPEEARRAGRKGRQVSRGGRGRLADGTDSTPTDNLGMA